MPQSWFLQFLQICMMSLILLVIARMNSHAGKFKCCLQPLTIVYSCHSGFSDFTRQCPHNFWLTNFKTETWKPRLSRRWILCPIPHCVFLLYSHFITAHTHTQNTSLKSIWLGTPQHKQHHPPQPAQTEGPSFSVPDIHLAWMDLHNPGSGLLVGHWELNFPIQSSWAK